MTGRKGVAVGSLSPDPLLEKQRVPAIAELANRALHSSYAHVRTCCDGLQAGMAAALLVKVAGDGGSCSGFKMREEMASSPQSVEHMKGRVDRLGL